MYVGNQLARIHIGKKALGMDEDTYRAFLARHTGKSSAAKLNIAERQRIIYAMNQLGAFKQQRKTLTQQQKACVAKWYELRRKGIITSKDKSSLNRFCKKHFGKWNIADLDPQTAGKLYRCLENWLREYE